jgi:hypothetical protein
MSADISTNNTFVIKKPGRPKKIIQVPKNKQDNQDKENKRGYLAKNIAYAKEQKELADKVLDILGISETNKVFYIGDIDEEKVKQIIALEGDVRRYFKCGTWTYFAKTVPIPWLSLAKSVLKATGVNFKFISSDQSSKVVKIIKKGFSIELK